MGPRYRGGGKVVVWKIWMSLGLFAEEGGPAEKKIKKWTKKTPNRTKARGQREEQ